MLSLLAFTHALRERFAGTGYLRLPALVSPAGGQAADERGRSPSVHRAQITKTPMAIEMMAQIGV